MYRIRGPRIYNIKIEAQKYWKCQEKEQRLTESNNWCILGHKQQSETFIN